MLQDLSRLNVPERVKHKKPSKKKSGKIKFPDFAKIFYVFSRISGNSESAYKRYAMHSTMAIRVNYVPGLNSHRKNVHFASNIHRMIMTMRRADTSGKHLEV